jgi:hypothetical protein
LLKKYIQMFLEHWNIITIDKFIIFKCNSNDNCHYYLNDWNNDLIDVGLLKIMKNKYVSRIEWNVYFYRNLVDGHYNIWYFLVQFFFHIFKHRRWSTYILAKFNPNFNQICLLANSINLFKGSLYSNSKIKII